MEANWNLRFLIPPFILAGVILTADLHAKSVGDDGFLDRLELNDVFGENADASKLIAAVIAGGIGLIAAGFVLSTLTVFVLNVVSMLCWCKWLCCCKWHYLIQCGQEYRNKILNHFGIVDGKNISFFCLVAAFQHHDTVPAGIQGLLQRRWNFFWIRANSITAIIAGIITCLILDYCPSFAWWCFWVVLGIILLWNIVVNWCEMKRLTEFAADLKPQKAKPRGITSWPKRKP